VSAVAIASIYVWRAQRNAVFEKTKATSQSEEKERALNAFEIDVELMGIEFPPEIVFDSSQMWWGTKSAGVFRPEDVRRLMEVEAFWGEEDLAPVLDVDVNLLEEERETSKKTITPSTLMPGTKSFPVTKPFPVVPLGNEGYSGSPGLKGIF